MVYTSESLELAVLEALVHLDIDLLPNDVYQVGFELDDKFIMSFALAVRLATEALLGNLRARPKTRPAGCNTAGTAWLHPPDGLPRYAMGALKIGRRSIPSRTASFRLPLWLQSS